MFWGLCYIWISFSLVFIPVCFITIFHFADCPTSSHSTKTVSPSPAFLDEDEFSDFMQGPVEVSACGPSSMARPFQSFLPTTPLSQVHTQKAGAQPLPPGQVPVSFAIHGGPGQIPCFSTASASPSVQKAGNSSVIIRVLRYSRMIYFSYICRIIQCCWQRNAYIYELWEWSTATNARLD